MTAPAVTRTRYRCTLCGSFRRSSTVPTCSGGAIKHRTIRMQVAQ